MRAFIYSDNKATELPFAEGAGHFGKADLVWLHVDGRLDAAPVWIEAQADIPEIAVSALRASETRPRWDQIGQGAIINLRGLGLTPEDDPDALVSMRFWAEEGRVISLSYRTPVALDTVVDEFLAGSIHDPGDLITAFASTITGTLDPEVAELGDQLDEIEAKLEEKIARSLRRKVSRIRADAISFRRFVAPQRTALEGLALANCHWLDDHDRLHLREAADRFARMAEELEAVRERAAIVHDELTDLRGEQMDARALLLSIVALIFLPLTFITGLLGMNVKGIPYAEESWSFWGVVGFCVFVGLSVLGWFVRARWVRGKSSI
jgi:zinc transporter